VSLEPLRGFRDILPPESKKLATLMNRFSSLVESYGYKLVIPPTLERFELFALKSGEEIRRSMFTFSDKSGREVALRPEATASIARIYLKHLRALPKPIRIYYIVNCFRYENPQRARYREFWQAGVEVIGAYTVAYDFEVIKLLADYLSAVGLSKSAKIKIGNTRVYRGLFKAFGIEEETQDHILHLMDKKMYDKALSVVRSSTAKGDELASILSSLWDVANDITAALDVVSDYPEARQGVEELIALDVMLKDYGLPVEAYYDLSFARGLAYYTGIIFEAEVKGFEFSVAGGGRYDGLIGLYGGEDVPGTGFAVGLDRVLYVIDQLGLELEAEEQKVKVAIAVLKDDLAGYAAKVQKLLVTSRSGIEAVAFYDEKLGKLIPRLLDEGYTYLVVIGPREASEGKVTLKHLLRKQQVSVKLDELPNYIEA
jgi:histidyl-tRNA synthetase